MIPTLSLSSLLNSDKSRFCCLHPIPCIWFITLPYKFFLKKKICCISSTGRGKAIYTITSPFDLISNSHSWQFFTDFQITQLGNKNQQVRNSESSSKYKFLPEMHSRNHFTCLTFGVCTAPVWWAQLFSCSGFSETSWSKLGLGDLLAGKCCFSKQTQPQFNKLLGDLASQSAATKNANYFQVVSCGDYFFPSEISSRLSAWGDMSSATVQSHRPVLPSLQPGAHLWLLLCLPIPPIL